MFIALVGAGPQGFIARDRQSRARAVATGYLAGLDGGWTLSLEEYRWWLTVAGVQFAHRRRQRRGQPGVLPWQDAITALHAALQSTDAWAPES